MTSIDLKDCFFDNKTAEAAETSSEEGNAQIRELLNRAQKLEGKGNLAAHEAEIKDGYQKLGMPNGRRLLLLLLTLNGQDLFDALLGAGALGRVIEGHSGITFFGLSIIIAYVSLFLPPKVIRNIVAMCRLLFCNAKERKNESMARLLRCSKNTIRAGSSELFKNGLTKPGEGGNAPGAGRPSFKAYFAGIMTNLLIAVTGLDEEALGKACVSYNVERVISDQNQDNDQMFAKIATAESITNDFQALTALVSDAQAKIMKALSAAPNKEAVALKKLKADLGRELDRLQNEMDKVSEWGDASSKDTETSSGGNTAPTTPEEQAACYAKSLKSQALPQVLSEIIDLFTERCKRLLEAFVETKEMDGPSSYYHLVKKAKRINLKSFINKLSDLWEVYAALAKDIDAMVDDFSSRLANGEQEDQKEKAGAYDILEVDVASLHKEALEALARITGMLNGSQGNKPKDVKRAALSLEKLSELFSGERFQSILSSGDPELKCILIPLFHYLKSSCSHWMSRFDKGSTAVKGASSAAKEIDSERFRQGLNYFIGQLNNYFDDQEEAKAGMSPETIIPGSVGGSDKAVPVSEQDMLMASREEARKAISQLLEKTGQLKQDLEASLEKRIQRKNSRESAIQGAQDLLCTLSDRLESDRKSIEETEKPWVLKSLTGVVLWISEYLDGRLMKWDKDDNGCRKISYTIANKIAASLFSQGSIAYLKAEWERLDGFYDGSIANPESPGKFIGIEEAGVCAEWFMPGTVLSPAERCKLVKKLWSQGKDPRQPSTWIGYIVEQEYARNYGDPTDKMKCCRITRSELLNAFHCLTGTTCSEETLWSIFTKEMHYSGRQCAKLDQIGKPSKYRDEQFQHIKDKEEKADRNRTLTISVDTKAFLLLGRLKHDSGRIMCRKDGRVYRVLDHDFALKLRQIYPNGTSLVDDSRLDENAVLHPIGAYCLNDGTGYVSLVLGKDTAESVCNLIRMIIDSKRETMPELDTVLIMCDGGGSNMANGVAWQAELLKLADDKNVTLDVVHFCPGCSRHNPVEHRLFAALSNNWRGKPFIDIGRVLGYVNSTRNKSLTVRGWFDSKRYYTNAEKKKLGMKVLNRSELDKLAGDRITHEFPEGDMYKWNYVVRPSADKRSVV